MNKYFLVTVLTTFQACAAYSAQACNANFSVSGNLLSGKTYRTNGVMPGVSRLDAFARVLKFTADNGFTVLKSDRDAGTISAAQSSSYSSGKLVPLNIAMADSGSDTLISLSYIVPLGSLSPDDAVQKHFCLTIAAAGNSSGNLATATQTAGSQNSVAPAAPAQKRSSMRGFAAITPEQQKAIAVELFKVVPNESIRQILKDAAPTLTTHIERLSCMAEDSGLSALLEYSAPGARISFWNAAMPYTRYHNRASCMTVTRVQGWNAPALNALQFEVVYKAEDSGEVTKSQHEVIKQPDGAWLFMR